MSTAAPAAPPSATPWSSLRRVSYTLPTLVSLQDDPRHRYLADGDHNHRALPVLDLGLEPHSRAGGACLGSAPQVRILEEGGGVRPALPREMQPQHMRPVTALALDTQTSVRSSPHGTPTTGLLYSGGRDGLVCVWELGLGGAPTRPHFRQSIRAHNNWIAAMLLCNQSQTIVTGSSDCTIKAWRPHDEGGGDLCELGTHKDFVKALALAPAADWIVSASLDRQTCLWDLREGRKAPMWRATAPAAIYAAGSSRSGGVITTGGVDKVVRGWDPRMRDSTFELVGHQDNVRTLAVAADGRHVLSGSADTTLRLWDVAQQRCVHTFTHHNSSVWSLYTSDETLGTFYSGDRDGYLCKVDWDAKTDLSEGDCILLAHEQCADAGTDTMRSASIQSIVADHGQNVWTSNVLTPSIRRWSDIPSRTNRMRVSEMHPPTFEHLHGVALDHCINLKPGDTWKALSDSGLAELIGGVSHSPTATRFAPSEDLVQQNIAHLPREKQVQIMRQIAYASCVVAEDAKPLFPQPECEVGGHPGALRAVVLNDRIHALSIDTGGVVALWNIVRAACLGTFDVDRVRHAGTVFSLQAMPTVGAPEHPWRPQDTPGDTLELVQSLIEGDGVVPPWCSLDTSVGELIVHLDEDKVWGAEAYLDEIAALPFPNQQRGPWTEERVSLGVCVLRNLFAQVNAAEASLRSAHSDGVPLLVRALTSGRATPESLLQMPLTEVLPPELGKGAAPNETLESLLARMTAFATQAPAVPMQTQTKAACANTGPLASILLHILHATQEQARTDTTSATTNGTSPVDGAASPTGLFGLWRPNAPRKGDKAAAAQPAAVAPVAPEAQHVKQITQLLQGALRPPPPTKGAPHIPYPPSTLVTISHDLRSSEHQQTAYRGRVEHMARDTPLLELLAPYWLMDLLLNGRAPEREPHRFKVVLDPWTAPPNDPQGAACQLPAVRPIDRVLASARMVRAGRVTTYIQGLLVHVGTTLPPASSPHESPIELLCNGMLLDPYTTLAQCQRHYWKSSQDMALQYRLRSPPSVS